VKGKNGSMSETAESSAEALAQTFFKTFTKDSSGTPTECVEYISRKTGNITITKDAIVNKLEALDTEKAIGPDNIAAHILKNCAVELSKPLELLFNKSLQDGSLPQAWKNANITPIFKKGDRTNPINYRPISVTPITVKILEGFVLDALQQHLKAAGWKNPNQHGYGEHRSTTTNFIASYQDIFAHLDQKTPVDVIFIDLEKAFDTVTP